MRAPPLSAALATAVALCGGGCGGGDSSDGGELTVSAAASLADAFTAYGQAVEGDERFSFAGSDELAAQIRQGAGPGVFASADTTYPEELHDDHLVSKPVVFARNQLVVAVPPGSSIESVDDLADPGLDLVIGAEGVPVGDYTRKVLGHLPQAESNAIFDNVRSEESDVKGVVGKLTQGAADAGFVYASDVAAAGNALRAIDLPPRLRPRVSYGITAVDAGADPEGAQAFIDGLLTPRGQRVLDEQGLLTVPTD